MKPIQTLLTFLLAVTLLLGGCSGASEAKSPSAQTTPSEEAAQTEETAAPEEQAAAETEETAEAEEMAEPEEQAAAETEEMAEAEEMAAAPEEQASAAGGETYEVKMGSDTGQLKYVPEKLTVHPGDSVKFVMNKLAPHNVVFDSNGIPNGDKALASSLSKNKLLSGPGETHTVTFPEDTPKGEYGYYCQPHRGAGMSGKIIVE